MLPRKGASSCTSLRASEVTRGIRVSLDIRYYWVIEDYADSSLASVPMGNKVNQQPGEFRERARFALQRNDEALAEASYARVLESQPGDLEALNYLARCQLLRGVGRRAVELMQTAVQSHPDDAPAWHQLGTSHMLDGNMQAAADSLHRALQLAPGIYTARLRRALALEQLGDSRQALIEYFTALNIAQKQGQWLSDETTAPEARDVVQHAVRYIATGRHALFNDVLEPLRQRYGRSELVRVEQALAGYLGEQPIAWQDPRQRSRFFHLPGVPARTYYPRELLPWYAELEAKTSVIRDELRAVLQETQNLEPFLGDKIKDRPDMLAAFGAGRATWDAYFFHRHGKRYDEHCARCPQTAAALDVLPLDRVRDHSPETLFSVLRPGTHILPHRGVTNTRVTTHLPLIVPPDCAIRVGGEIHAWQEGRCVTFDDTMEHEAWNKSSETRVVLIFDCWNPDMSEIERLAVTDVVEAIGDFIDACRRNTPESQD
jgi:aspartate beta-hydroxylase